jgi:hypothetical protein
VVAVGADRPLTTRVPILCGSGELKRPFSLYNGLLYSDVVLSFDGDEVLTPGFGHFGHEPLCSRPRQMLFAAWWVVNKQTLSG